MGSDIAFGHGQYQPDTSDGRLLLAHELAHVVQGHSGLRRQPSGAPQPTVTLTVTPTSSTAPPRIELEDARPWIVVAPWNVDDSAVANALYGSSLVPPKPGPPTLALLTRELEVQPERLIEPHRTRFYRLMNDRLQGDIASVERILLQTRIGNVDETMLINYVDWWARRKDLRTESGQTYFDAFLARLKSDTWHTDYLITRSTSRAFLDKLYVEVEEKVGQLNSLIAQNSREFGAYRPLWSRLEDMAKVAQGGTAGPDVDKGLVQRTSDLIADRLAGRTSAEDSRVIGDLITGLPPSAQAQVLQSLMNRYAEKDWTGIFGRFGEAWKGGMVYFLFEDLSEKDRARVGEALKKSGVLPAEQVDALAAGRGWGGKYLPYTTRLGHEASEFYARECTQGEGVGSGAACGALAFSVLWTPETAGATIMTLGTAGLGGPVAQAFPTLGKIMLVGGTGLAAYQGTQALVELVTGKSMATGKPLSDTDKLTRGILLVSSALFLAAGFMAAAKISAGSTALAPRSSGAADPTPSPAAGAAAEGQIPVRVVSMDPATGECIAVGRNPTTGEVAILRVNMKTGDGVMQSGSRVRAISRWQMQPERPLLGPAETPNAAPADPSALPAPARYRTVPEILPNPNEPFTAPEVEAAYQAYRLAGSQPKGRFDWMRATRHGPRATLMNILGPNFPAPAASAVEGDMVQLGRIGRPATLTQGALDQHLATLRAQPERLSARLSAMRRSGALADEVSLGHFNILKGNIGEILAQAIQTQVLSTVRVQFPDARSYGGLRMQLPGGQPKEFSDNLIASEASGNLYVRAGFEVKAGGAGGQEATEQIHSWVEGRLQDGATLILADGRRFLYAPDQTGSGRVIFLASAPRHIIAPQGAEQLGGGSAMGVPGSVERHALPLTPEEVNYIARLIAETIAAAATP